MSNKFNDKLKEAVNKDNIKNELAKSADSSKKFISGFRDFINKGNVLDLAVGVIIGGAFSDIVKSFINNIISPIIGCFTVDGFRGLTIPIFKANIGIGDFLMDVINFIIMAFVVYLIVKVFNKFKREKPKEEPKKSDETKLLEEILDELKKQNKD